MFVQINQTRETVDTAVEYDRYIHNDSSLKANDLLNIPQQRTEDSVQGNVPHSRGTLTHSGFLSCSNNVAIQKNSSQFL